MVRGRMSKRTDFLNCDKTMITHARRINWYNYKIGRDLANALDITFHLLQAIEAFGNFKSSEY